MVYFLKGSAHIVGKLVMHPCVPFCSSAMFAFLLHPSVHRAHWLKSTSLRFDPRLGASDFRQWFTDLLTASDTRQLW